MNQKNQTNKPAIHRNSDQNNQLQSAEIQASPSRGRKSNSLYNAPKHRSEGTVHSKKKTGFPLGTVICMMMMTVLLMMTVSNYVVLNEYQHQVAQLRTELRDLDEEKDSLESKLEQKNN